MGNKPPQPPKHHDKVTERECQFLYDFSSPDSPEKTREIAGTDLLTAYPISKTEWDNHINRDVKAKARLEALSSLLDPSYAPQGVLYLAPDL